MLEGALQRLSRWEKMQASMPTSSQAKLFGSDMILRPDIGAAGSIASVQTYENLASIRAKPAGDDTPMPVVRS